MKAFYASFPMYVELIVTKVQMLDPSHLLIKYGAAAYSSSGRGVHSRVHVCTMRTVC